MADLVLVTLQEWLPPAPQPAAGPGRGGGHRTRGQSPAPGGRAVPADVLLRLGGLVASLLGDTITECLSSQTEGWLLRWL